MIFNERIFKNYFDDIKIISIRLTNFSNNLLNQLIAANNGGAYTALINRLTPALAAFQAELGEVNVSLNILKGATLTNGQVIRRFKTTVSEEEPFIARALGGKNTPAYLEFYPQGISEYLKATKNIMPVLTSRIKVAATAHAAALGPALAATLQAYEASWTDSRNTQQQQMGSVNDNRTGRSNARTELEAALLFILHAIAGMFPGNVAQCGAFFNFHLLFAPTRHRHKNFAAAIAAGQAVAVLNITFTDSASITFRNPDDNAAYAVWLAAIPGEPLPESFLTVQPGQAHQIKPSALGSLKNTFLMIKNLSDINEGAYQVEVVG